MTLRELFGFQGDDPDEDPQPVIRHSSSKRDSSGFLRDDGHIPMTWCRGGRREFLKTTPLATGAKNRCIRFFHILYLRVIGEMDTWDISIRVTVPTLRE